MISTFFAISIVLIFFLLANLVLFFAHVYMGHLLRNFYFETRIMLLFVILAIIIVAGFLLTQSIVLGILSIFFLLLLIQFNLAFSNRLRKKISFLFNKKNSITISTSEDSSSSSSSSSSFSRSFNF